MKIALYNWAPIHEQHEEGGGVSVYLRNLAASLAVEGHDVFVISSGYVYDVTTSQLFFRIRKNRDVNNICHIDIVNSRVIAPSFMMFPLVTKALNEKATKLTFETILNRHGPFDVLHFQNIEGIPFEVFDLKNKFPYTKFILTNHNYHSICQQVNLWRRDKERCTDYRNGAACYSCNPFKIDYSKVLAARVAAEWKRHTSSPRLKKAFLFLAVLAVRYRAGWFASFDVHRDDGFEFSAGIPAGEEGPAAQFMHRRQKAIAYINKYADAVISVSDAVEKILVKNGLEARKSVVNYIGTKHFNGNIPERIWNSVISNGVFHLCFLGYSRADKGFYFLLDALKGMPAEMEGRISLTFAGRFTDLSALHQLRAFESKLAGLNIISGYSHEQLAKILETVDLGLVVPLWDDALPQVAIEFVSHGIPILVSDRGGQKELAQDPAFIFEAGNQKEFWSRLRAIYSDPTLTEQFWDTVGPIRTMSQHVAELIEIYSGETLHLKNVTNH